VNGLDQLNDSPLTGHAMLMGNRTFAGQNTESVLAHFARTKPAAIGKYRKFLQDGLVSFFEVHEYDNQFIAGHQESSPKKMRRLQTTSEYWAAMLSRRGYRGRSEPSGVFLPYES
jgi:hypothetical protein